MKRLILLLSICFSFSAGAQTPESAPAAAVPAEAVQAPVTTTVAPAAQVAPATTTTLVPVPSKPAVAAPAKPVVAAPAKASVPAPTKPAVAAPAAPVAPAAAAAPAAPANPNAKVIRIGGGSGPMENIFKKVEEPFEKASGFNLELSPIGPEKAFEALDQGKMDIASAGLSLESWFQLLEEKKIVLKNAKTEFKVRVIGRDIIKVNVNKNVGIAKLDNEQLKKIFSGAVKNWKEVGGPDKAIVIVNGTKIAGIYKFFAEKGLGAVITYPAGMKDSGDNQDVLKTIAATDGAIGLGAMGAIIDGIIQPEIPKIGRPIQAATKGIPSAEILQLFQFIEKEGQKYIAQ